jgi:hypothetical protein
MLTRLRLAAEFERPRSWKRRLEVEIRAVWPCGDAVSLGLAVRLDSWRFARGPGVLAQAIRAYTNSDVHEGRVLNSTEQRNVLHDDEHSCAAGHERGGRLQVTPEMLPRNSSVACKRAKFDSDMTQHP